MPRAISYVDDDTIKRRGRVENLSKYSLTPELFELIFASQGRRCAVCGTKAPGSNGWCVDHDHSCCSGASSCGKCVRGILCSECNLGLGKFKDEPSILRAAAEYLEDNRTHHQ